MGSELFATHVGIVGHNIGKENDPFSLIVSALERPFMSSPVSKNRREDLQIFSLLQVLSMAGIARNPLAVREGEDPPDRYLVHGDRTWGTELTELTIEDLRIDLAIARNFGRELQDRVRARSSDFPHLQGMVVTLNKIHDTKIPRDYRTLMTQVEAALAVDNGYEGQDVDSSKPPHQMSTRGSYGDHGPFSVMANRAQHGNEIIITASCQSQIYQSEAIAALKKRIAEKDREGNEILIITCGLVDPRGYVCQLDHSIFELIREASANGSFVMPQPTHIRGIVLHAWHTANTCHWSLGEDLPWITQSGKTII